MSTTEKRERALLAEFDRLAARLRADGHAAAAEHIAAMSREIKFHPENDAAYKVLTAGWVAEIGFAIQRLDGDAFDMLTLAGLLTIDVIEFVVAMAGLDREAATEAIINTLREWRPVAPKERLQ